MTRTERIIYYPLLALCVAVWFGVLYVVGKALVS